MSDDPYPSPFDRFDSEGIVAGVADGERLFGYSIAEDLARSYQFGETMFLLAAGRLPTDQEAQWFNTALHMAMYVTIADASVHAARVARHVHSRGEPATVASTAALAVAQQSRWVVEQHAAWLQWLATDRSSEPPDAAIDTDASELVQSFARLLPSSCLPNLLPYRPSVTAAAIALLAECGLTRPEQLATVLTSARFPIAMAEAFAVEDGGLWDYPLNLPYWVYGEEEE